jgi:hypothetical protein
MAAFVTVRLPPNVTMPAVVIRIPSVAPLLPTWKMIASEVPMPEVERIILVELTAVPPMFIGLVIDVVTASVLLNVAAPVTAIVLLKVMAPLNVAAPDNVWLFRLTVPVNGEIKLTGLL